MPSRRRLFRPVWIILALLTYVGCRLLPPLALGPAGTTAVAALLLAAGILVPRSIRRSGLLAWIGLTAYRFLLHPARHDAVARRVSSRRALLDDELALSGGARAFRALRARADRRSHRRGIRDRAPAAHRERRHPGLAAAEAPARVFDHTDQRCARRPDDSPRIRRALGSPRERAARRSHRGDRRSGRRLRAAARLAYRTACRSYPRGTECFS